MNNVPKMKSRRNARLRFKVTATGKVLRRSNYAGHIMTKKTTKRKRHLRRPRPVADGDARNVKRMLLAE